MGIKKFEHENPPKKDKSRPKKLQSGLAKTV
jgi:hypothetical protein